MTEGLSESLASLFPDGLTFDTSDNWGEGDYAGDDGDGYDEEGDDLDAEAEEMARRLGDQLLADIAKAQLEASANTAVPTPDPPPTSNVGGNTFKKQEAAILTMKTILSFASKVPLVHATLSATIVPAANNTNILDLLNECVNSRKVSKRVAKPLSELLVSLAKSDALFSSLRNSNAPSIQLDLGKRKRGNFEDEENLVDYRNQKRPALDQPDLRSQLGEAVRIISHALTSPNSTANQLDASLVSAIRDQLHQVSLFAVTSAPRAIGETTNALQEIGALIQMLGVLSGVHIGAGQPMPPPQTAWESSASPPTDIGTAVYPCLVPGCPKTFHRLYYLRSHQRLHTLADRPYRCPHCPASFVRNHDLKRHAKLHDRKAWKCGGCGKVFSRRDAIKRHKDSKARSAAGDGEDCFNSEVLQVDVDKVDGEEDVSRRAKLWNGIVANQLAGVNSAGIVPGMGGGSSGLDEGSFEEGEVPQMIIEQAQAVVLQLYGPLQNHVARGLAGPLPPGSVLGLPQSEIAAGQATLASVIARAQAQQQATSALFPSEPPLSHSATPQSAQPFHTQQSDPSSYSTPTQTSLSLSLSEEQTRLLEQAIAQAALAAQAQAEAEAALEEEGEEGEEYDDNDDVYEEPPPNI